MSPKRAKDVTGSMKRTSRGRNATLVPPLRVGFEAALGALLRTPPPSAADLPERPKAKKARTPKKRAGKKRAANTR